MIRGADRFVSTLFVMPSNIAPPIFSLASAEFVHNDTCATGLGGHCNPVGRVG